MADDHDHEGDARGDEVRSVAPWVDDDEETDAAGDRDRAATEEGGSTSGEAAAPGQKRGKETTRTVGDRTVTRRAVTSKRVTPKGGAAARAKAPGTKRGRAEEVEASTRYTPPGTGAYARGPSPWWVPALMFGLLILGAVLIMANYMGAFGEPANLNLVIGLVLILGGIITATQLR